MTIHIYSINKQPITTARRYEELLKERQARRRKENMAACIALVVIFVTFAAVCVSCI